jgi:PadR family transcriptional regulator, regulatory protein PadR
MFEPGRRPATGPERVTLPVLQVLVVLLEQEEAYGLDLCRRTALGAGTVYPALARMELWGWVESRWEDPESAQGTGRPHRRFYRLTTEGRRRSAALFRRRFPLGLRIPANGG